MSGLVYFRLVWLTCDEQTFNKAANKDEEAFCVLMMSG